MKYSKLGENRPSSQFLELGQVKDNKPHAEWTYLMMIEKKRSNNNQSENKGSTKTHNVLNLIIIVDGVGCGVGIFRKFRGQK